MADKVRLEPEVVRSCPFRKYHPVDGAHAGRREDQRLQFDHDLMSFHEVLAIR